MSTELQWWEVFFMNFAKVNIVMMVIPIIVALFYRKLWNQPLFVFFLWCSFKIAINLLEQGVVMVTINHYDFIGPYLKFFGIKNTFFLIILYYLKDFLILGWFYGLIIPVSPANKYIIQIGKILAILTTINHLFIEGYNDFGVFNPFVNGLFVIILPLLYLWFSQKQSLRIPLKRNPYLWISLGLVIPSIFSFFLYLAGDFIHGTNMVLYYQLYSVRNAFDIIGQVLIAIGFAHGYYARFITTEEENQEPANIGS